MVIHVGLVKSYELLARTEALTHIGSWEMDILHKINNWSEETYRIFGITPETYDNTYESFLKLVHPDDIKKIEWYIRNPIRGPIDLEYRIVRPDGTIRNVYQKMEFLFDGQGNPVYLYGTIQDITEMKQMQEQNETMNDIMKFRSMFKILTEKHREVFEIMNPDGTIIYVSKALEDLLGINAKDKIGKKIYDYCKEEDLDKFIRLVDSVMENPEIIARDIVSFDTPDGRNLFLEVSLQNFLIEPIINGIACYFRDITNEIRMTEKINYINNHDEISGLPNHINLNKHLLGLCKRKETEHSKFALMMLDIDEFKYINFTFGYDIGNQLLIRIADRIKECLIDGVYISRYADDQLAIIIEDSKSLDQYKRIAKNILGLFSEAILVEHYEFNICVNIGICVYPIGAKDAEALKKNAKAALFRSRKEGKNNYKFYNADFNLQNLREFIIRNDLHKAINQDQFIIHFQPMVAIKTNEIIAAEALIRWKHPELGIISPGEFIPITEETGYITIIGEWLLEEICKTYKKWLTDGLPSIKISVNISSIQFFENNFVDKIINKIEKYGLDPHFLIIEITESIFLCQLNKAIEGIKQLQSYGIQIALDDFGTGYSSLAYLSAFKIDIVKIDKLFIKNYDTDLSNAVIIKGIINMTRELKIKIVAEGIENIDQLNFLKNLNCYTGQGFLYSKPVDVEEFTKKLEKKLCIPGKANVE